MIRVLHDNPEATITKIEMECGYNVATNGSLYMLYIHLNKDARVKDEIIYSQLAYNFVKEVIEPKNLRTYVRPFINSLDGSHRIQIIYLFNEDAKFINAKRLADYISNIDFEKEELK